MGMCGVWISRTVSSRWDSSAVRALTWVVCSDSNDYLPFSFFLKAFPLISVCVGGQCTASGEGAVGGGT